MLCEVSRLLFDEIRRWLGGRSCMYCCNIRLTSLNCLMLIEEGLTSRCLVLAMRLLARESSEAFFPELELLLICSMSDFSAIIMWKSKHLMLYLIALLAPPHSSSSSIWSSMKSNSESPLDACLNRSAAEPLCSDLLLLSFWFFYFSKTYWAIFNFEILYAVSISINCYRSW